MIFLNQGPFRAAQIQKQNSGLTPLLDLDKLVNIKLSTRAINQLEFFLANHLFESSVYWANFFQDVFSRGTNFLSGKHGESFPECQCSEVFFSGGSFQKKSADTFIKSI